jgi:hypothetical protein
LEARVLPLEEIFQTPSGISSVLQSPQTLPGQSERGILGNLFLLSWSHYVRLMSMKNPQARRFYESEAVRGGWSVRQLDRQLSTQFFERTSHSKQQAAMLARGQKPKLADAVSVANEIRDPYLLEFLNLKDEYSESDLKDALIELPSGSDASCQLLGSRHEQHSTWSQSSCSWLATSLSRGPGMNLEACNLLF